MNIDYTKTLNVYNNYTGKVNYLNKLVHDYVLLSGFLDSHSKSILKSVDHISSSFEELLVSTFISKLSYKLPALRMGVSLGVFHAEEARLIASSLIVQVLIDNGSLVVDKRVEPVFSKDLKKFHTRLYLILGGSFEKNLLKGIEVKPGVVKQKEINGWKLNGDEKAFLRRMSSIPFVISNVCTKELLSKGYSLKVDWDKTVDKNGRSLVEDPIIRKRRYGTMSDTILALKEDPAFYLPLKYDDVRRCYYEAASLEGMRPHGKLWETLMIDSAISFQMTEEDERVLKHVIYVILHGRCTVDEANQLFTLNDLLESQAIDPFDQEDEDSFGEAILLNKAYRAIIDFRKGNLSRYMFGYDLTNSGLIMSGVSFHSEEMMSAGNVGGEGAVVDSHTVFGQGYGLDLERKDIKNIHTCLLHGSALTTVAKTISSVTGEDIDALKVSELNRQAYGPAVDNITAIAEWGTHIVGNEQTVLRWTLPDGFSACSRAYLESVPVEVHVISASHKEGYTKHLIVRDMPWIEDSKGFPIYTKETFVGGVSYKVTQKKRGLFARITHGCDAYLLRAVCNAVLSTGRPMLIKHDDYIMPAGALGIATEAAQDVFQEMFTTNLYQEAIDEIIENSPYSIPSFELIQGDGKDTVRDSTNFLMP